MPIFRIEAEIEVMVFAETEEEAEREANAAVREELRWSSGNFNSYGPTQVTDPLHLFDWADSRPYNRKDNMTCKQIMAAEAEAERARVPTAAELEAAGQLRLAK